MKIELNHVPSLSIDEDRIAQYAFFNIYSC